MHYTDWEETAVRGMEETEGEAEETEGTDRASTQRYRDTEILFVLPNVLRAFYEAAVDSKLRFGFPFFSSSSRRMKRVVMSASGLWMST